MNTGIESGISGQQLALTPGPATALDAPTAEKEFSFFGDDGFTFSDVLDVINPLQHIPFISTMYRDATDDTIAAAPRVMGATLFFGPFGLVGALANVALEESTGKDVGEHMADIFGNDEADAEQQAEVAQNSVQIDGEAKEPVDPVLAWAQREAAWSQTRDSQGQLSRSGGRVLPSSIPDAGPLVQDHSGDLAQVSRAASDVAFLTDDLRSAARAYQAAAGLSSELG